MSQKQRKPETLHPAIDEFGKLDFSKLFSPQPKQIELIREYELNGGTYRTLVAPQCMSVGGYRSGKTQGALWFGINEFILKFAHCDILVLRRTFKDLEQGAISDLKALLPETLGLYQYDSTKHVATFSNGSRIVFGHCADMKERSINQYLGQAYPLIIVDECAQFSMEAWQLLRARNAVNAACEYDEHNNLPIPCMWGLTNPMGIHWSLYHTLFVLGEPLEKNDKSRKDLHGNWYTNENGEWICIRDKENYAFQTSTVFDNPLFMKRDPQYVANLQAMPKAKRDKILWGLMGTTEGAYYDCWTPEFHVINMRDDPEAVIFQDWQLAWAGEDWGMGGESSGSANATYLFTKAMVKSPVTGDYRMKTVCFQELVVTGGKTYKELASLIKAKAKLPDGKAVKLSSIHFSHEKFSRVMDSHTPAEEYSRALKAVGLPNVTRGTMNRIASASFLYNELKSGNLVFLDNCVEIINAIPRLMRNPNSLDDVLKTKTKGDDCFDACRLGVYGQLCDKQRPQSDRIAEHCATLEPLAKFYYMARAKKQLEEQSAVFVEEKTSSTYWTQD